MTITDITIKISAQPGAPQKNLPAARPGDLSFTGAGMKQVVGNPHAQLADTRKPLEMRQNDRLEPSILTTRLLKPCGHFFQPISNVQMLGTHFFALTAADALACLAKLL